MIVIRSRGVNKITLTDDISGSKVIINDKNSECFSYKPCNCINERCSNDKCVKSNRDFRLDIYPKDKEYYHDDNINLPKIFSNKIEIEYNDGSIENCEVEGVIMLDSDGKICLEKNIIL